MIAMILLLAACSPQKKCAPASSLTADQAKLVATAAKMLTPDGAVCSVADTNSMLPTFDRNVFLVVEKRGYADIAVGDVVAYRGDDKLIVHRIVRQSPDGWIVRGDANDREDPTPVTPSNFYGRVAVIIFSRR